MKWFVVFMIEFESEHSIFYVLLQSVFFLLISY